MSKKPVKRGREMLLLGDRQRFTGTDLVQLIDIAEEVQRRSTDEEKCFSQQDLEEELTSLGYAPNIVSRALVDYQSQSLVDILETSKLATPITLLETRKKIKQEINEIECSSYSTYLPNLLRITGALSAAVAALILGRIYVNADARYIPFLFSLVAGAVLGGSLGKTIQNRSMGKVKFEEDKESRLRCKENRLKNLQEDIVRYDCQPIPGNLVLAYDSKLGNTVAYVKSIKQGRITLLQEYTVKETNGNQYRTFVEKSNPTSKIVCVLEPSVYKPLKESDLRSAELGTALVCRTEHSFMEFGVLGEINDAGFQLFADVNCKYPNHSYSFEQVNNRGILPVALQPKRKELPKLTC